MFAQTRLKLNAVVTGVLGNGSPVTRQIHQIRAYIDTSQTEYPLIAIENAADPPTVTSDATKVARIHNKENLMTLSLTRRAGLALAVAVIAGTMVPAQADMLDDIKAAGVLKVGIFQDFPPFASLNTSMKIEGYDTEVADKLAAALGVKVELVGITGQNRIPFLTEGKVDLLLSIGYSDERAQVVDYTDAYAPYYIAVMGPKDLDVTDAASLSGKSIAVNRGTLEDTEVTKVAPADADIQRYSDYSGVISAFLSGQAQLMVVGNDVSATICSAI